jgi:hypothetical protein
VPEARDLDFCRAAAREHSVREQQHRQLSRK